MKKFTVYKGELNGKIVYIGTTIQDPQNRFRWHKSNGKDFKFTVLKQFNTKEEMLEEEFRLIKLHKPKYNKIKNRKQNLNVKLTETELNARKNNPSWCQSCLRRHVNTGYTICFFCSGGKK